nr:hypothetical protein [Candidatus Levybacteria bacterium]
MTHVSKKQLNKKAEKELLHNFNLVLADIKQEDEMEYFLNSLLSSTERLMLAKRLAIVILLKEGVPHISIASALNVTEATVSRMQLFLEARGGGYEVSLKKLAKKKMHAEFKSFLLKLARYSIRAAGGYVKPGVL